MPSLSLDLQLQEARTKEAKSHEGGKLKQVGGDADEKTLNTSTKTRRVHWQEQVSIEIRKSPSPLNHGLTETVNDGMTKTVNDGMTKTVKDGKMRTRQLSSRRPTSRSQPPKCFIAPFMCVGKKPKVSYRLDSPHSFRGNEYPFKDRECPSHGKGHDLDNCKAGSE